MLGSWLAVEHAPVVPVQAQLRQVVVVELDDVVVAVLGDVDVRLDLRAPGPGVAQAGPRVESADDVVGDLDVLERPAQQPGQFLELAGFDQLQMIADDPPGQAAAAVAALQLQQQALANVAGADAGRIERLYHLQRRLQVRRLGSRPSSASSSSETVR